MKLGVYIPNAPRSRAAIQQFQFKYEITPSIISWYQAWGDSANSNIRLEMLNIVRSFGATPMITWEPWNPAIPKSTTIYDDILAGRLDPYIRWWDDILRTFKRRVLLRFAHEMNGDWYPWGQSAQYVETWRYVRSKMTTAVNVDWVWSPNVSFSGSSPMKDFWPGEDQVDVLGLDGYNWNSPWVTPEELFGDSIKEIKRISDKELIIAETACTEHEDKPRWIKQLFKLEGVETIVWFNEHKELDWRINSSVKSSKAFRSCVEKGEITQ